MEITQILTESKSSSLNLILSFCLCVCGSGKLDKKLFLFVGLIETDIGDGT
jgi:hypothetical protein